MAASSSLHDRFRAAFADGSPGDPRIADWRLGKLLGLPAAELRQAIARDRAALPREWPLSQAGDGSWLLGREPALFMLMRSAANNEMAELLVNEMLRVFDAVREGKLRPVDAATKTKIYD
jgi:hypothetical protein